MPECWLEASLCYWQWIGFRFVVTFDPAIGGTFINTYLTTKPIRQLNL